MAEHRSLLRRVAGVAQATDSTLSVGERAWSVGKWGARLVGSGYLLGAFAIVKHWGERFSVWWTYGFVALAGFFGMWLISWLTARHLRPVPATSVGAVLPNTHEVTASVESPKQTNVVATKVGYYGTTLRRPGDHFSIPLSKGEGLPSWVRLADTPSRPSPEEKEQIQNIRAVWNVYGIRAGDALLTLFDRAIPSAPPEYWMELLRPMRDQLKTEMIAMTEAVDDASTMSFDRVQERLNSFLVGYFRLAKWVALVNENSLRHMLMIEPLKRYLERWLEANIAFRKQLRENLHERPENRGKLNIAFMFEAQSVVRFLDAATVLDLLPPAQQ